MPLSPALSPLVPRGARECGPARPRGNLARSDSAQGGEGGGEEGPFAEASSLRQRLDAPLPCPLPARSSQGEGVRASTSTRVTWHIPTPPKECGDMLVSNFDCSNERANSSPSPPSREERVGERRALLLKPVPCGNGWMRLSPLVARGARECGPALSGR